jgi:uncharacterized protein (TIGR02246 family)
MLRIPLVIACAAVVLAGCRTAAPVASPPARSAAQVVNEQLEMYNAQDLEGFLRTYADDAVLVAGGKSIAQGKQALRERYGKMFKSFPNNRCSVAEQRTEGVRVVLIHEIITGRAPEHPDPWDVGWVRYEVDDGVIKRVELP